MTNNFNYNCKFRALTCNATSCRRATRGGNTSRIMERQAQISTPNGKKWKRNWTTNRAT